MDVNFIQRLLCTAASGAAASDSAANRPPAVMVQFVSKRLRNHVISKRRDLKGKRLMLSDHLTARRSLLLRKATDLVAANKLQAAWSSEGKILIKTLQNHVTAVLDLSDLLVY